jgi:hypothetical protein
MKVFGILAYSFLCSDGIRIPLGSILLTPTAVYLLIFETPEYLAFPLEKLLLLKGLLLA